MKETRADQTRVSMKPGEIAIDFGLAGVAADGGREIAFSRRIALPPEAAHRLLLGLADSLRRGGPPAPAPPPERLPLEDLLDPTSGLDSSHARPNEAAGPAADVFAVVRALRVTYGHERSFRLRQGELLANRFLLSVDRKSLADAAEEAILAAWRQLQMPPEFVAAAATELPDARTFHFGFESDGAQPLLKVYVESGAVLDAAEAAGPGDAPLPLHVAFKWNPAQPDQRVVSRYMLHPKMTVAAIADRLESIYADGSAASLEIAREILALGAARMPEDDIQYIEVHEEGNERRSYDLNLYDAELTVADLRPLLMRMCSHLGVSRGRFQALYDQIKKRRFGHLAGGVHRNGGDFFNVYHGGVFVQEGGWRNAAATTQPAAGSRGR